jgi:hypothetical protein
MHATFDKTNNRKTKQALNGLCLIEIQVMWSQSSYVACMTNYHPMCKDVGDWMSTKVKLLSNLT